MTMGANDKRKVAILCGLGLVALYLVYTNVLAGPSTDAPAAARAVAAPDTRRSAAPVVPEPGLSADAPAAPRARAMKGRSEEFQPVLHSKRPEDRIDPRGVDPTLRLDLLAKIQGQAAGGERNLFQFAPPPASKVNPLKGEEPKIVAFVGPQKPPPPPPPAPPAPPPPIEFKYVGFATARDNGKKTAFFLDGDEIIPAIEGQMVKRRYRVMSIGVNSVLMEDTNSKRQQRLPLVEETPG